jgi:hypothetical protein
MVRFCAIKPTHFKHTHHMKATKYRISLSILYLIVYDLSTHVSMIVVSMRYCNLTALNSATAMSQHTHTCCKLATGHHA